MQGREQEIRHSPNPCPPNASSHWIEQSTGWSIKKFVRTAGRHRTVTIRAGTKTITAAQHHPKTSQLPSPRSTQPSVRTSLI
jgi:hypothetical protein